LLPVLADAPRLRVLATSQLPLALPGEHVWRVPGLELPGQRNEAGATAGAPGRSNGAGPDPADCDAVRFFVTRARERAPAFAATGPPLLAQVRRLVDVSWLDFATEPAPAHFRMLDPLREWALAQLERSGRADAVRLRLARHVAAVCAHAGTDRFRADLGDWPARLSLMSGTIQAAPAWCALAEPDLGADIAA